LSEERDSSLGLGSLWEELGLQALIALGNEEGGRSQRSLALVVGLDLMVEELLDMVDGEEVLSVH
jgi:hypothetical protein